MPLLVLVVLASMAVMLLGFRQESGSWGSGGMALSGFQQDERTQGKQTQHSLVIEQANHNDRIYLLLCANGCRSASSSGGAGRVQGSWETNDGRTLSWRCDTKNGTDGSFRVQGQTFDLSKGHVCLVDTSGGKVRVKQVKGDLSGIKPGVSLDVHKLAAIDPAVSTFLAANGAGQSATR
jgi:hypothetical protein